MSYSFTVSAFTKDEAKQKITRSFDEVVSNQPIHQRDRAAAEAAAHAFVDVCPDPATEAQQVQVTVYGSVGWRGDQSDANVTSASVNISAQTIG